GNICITDRYFLSTLAYGMSECSLDSLLQLHREIVGDDFLRPDAHIILDLDPEKAIERMEARGQGFDHFAKLEKLRNIRKNYQQLGERADLGDMWLIGADGPPEVIAQEAWSVIQTYLEP